MILRCYSTFVHTRFVNTKSKSLRIYHRCAFVHFIVAMNGNSYKAVPTRWYKFSCFIPKNALWDDDRGKGERGRWMKLFSFLLYRLGWVDFGFLSNFGGVEGEGSRNIPFFCFKSLFLLASCAPAQTIWLITSQTNLLHVVKIFTNSLLYLENTNVTPFCSLLATFHG